MASCVPCNTPPAPCNCKSTETCVQTPRNCTTCPQNICLSSGPDSSGSGSSSTAVGLGGTIGGAIGGAAAALALIAIGYLFWKRRPNNRNQQQQLRRSQHLSSSSYKHSSKHNNRFLKQIFARNHPQHSSQNHLTASAQTANIHRQSKPTHSVIYLPANGNSNSHNNLNNTHSPRSASSTTSSLHHKSSSSLNSFHHLADTIKSISPSDERVKSKRFSNRLSLNLQQLTHLETTQVSQTLTPTNLLNTPGEIPQNIAINGSNPNSPQHRLSSAAHPSSPHPCSLLNPLSAPEFNKSSTAPQPSLLTPAISLSSPNPSNINIDNNGTHKPIRPPRAPDLDLRLPPQSRSKPTDEVGASSRLSQTASSLSVPVSPTVSRQTTHSTDGLNSVQHQRPLSDISDSNTHDSHLSSILDPAMIVTPVTVVRTASGRQAAVQRVALRGQEKARVVRLPAPSSSAVGTSKIDNQANNTIPVSPLSSEILPDGYSLHHGEPHTGSSFMTSGTTEEDVRLPTPGIGRSFGSSRLSKQPALEGFITITTDHGQSIGSPPASGTSVGQFSIENRVSLLKKQKLCENPFGDSNAVGDDIGDDFDSRGSYAESEGVLTRVDAQLQSAHASVKRTPSNRNNNPRKMSSDIRQRTISLSSMIDQEVQSTVVSTEGLPPLPRLEELPGPFKPFAGQKPWKKKSIGGSNNEEPEARRSGVNVEDKNRLSGGGTEGEERRNSDCSMVSISYGSVLEGIPFNIGFKDDDLLSGSQNGHLSLGSTNFMDSRSNSLICRVEEDDMME